MFFNVELSAGDDYKVDGKAGANVNFEMPPCDASISIDYTGYLIKISGKLTGEDCGYVMENIINVKM